MHNPQNSTQADQHIPMQQDSHKEQPLKDQARPEHWFRQGAAAAWPICLGYLPVGLALA